MLIESTLPFLFPMSYLNPNGKRHCEVQVLLSQIADVRHKMHELYKIKRAGSGMLLHADTAGTPPEKDADANASFASKLVFAADKGRTDSVEKLIQTRFSSSGRHASLDQADDDGKTALFQASGRGYLPVVLALLDGRADPNVCHAQTAETPMSVAARKGHLDVLRALVAAGAAVSPRVPSDNTTPVWGAAMEGHADVVHFILQHGGNPNDRDATHTSALHQAAGKGSLETVDCLVACKADVSCRAAGPSEHTPLFYAAQYGHADVAEHLIYAGADPSTCDVSDGQAAISIAAEQGHLDVMKVLAAEGVRTVYPPVYLCGLSCACLCTCLGVGVRVCMCVRACACVLV